MKDLVLWNLLESFFSSPQLALTTGAHSSHVTMRGRWTVVSRAWTYFDSAGCLLSLCLLYWSVIVMHDHVTSHCEAFHGHTYLEFVDLLRRLLTKINRCHACLVSTLHWAQQSAEAGHTLCGQTFHSSPAFQTPQEFGEKSLMASNLATCYDVVHCNII